jgi:hypothetical protein
MGVPGLQVMLRGDGGAVAEPLQFVMKALSEWKSVLFIVPCGGGLLEGHVRHEEVALLRYRDGVM